MQRIHGLHRLEPYPLNPYVNFSHGSCWVLDEWIGWAVWPMPRPSGGDDKQTTHSISFCIPLSFYRNYAVFSLHLELEFLELIVKRIYWAIVIPSEYFLCPKIIVVFGVRATSWLDL